MNQLPLFADSHRLADLTIEQRLRGAETVLDHDLGDLDLGQRFDLLALVVSPTVFAAVES